MTGPLAGVKVFDLTIIGVGPFATQILANMGANVVAVEQGPKWPPAYQGSPPTIRGLSGLYMTCHADKRSLYLDLKNPVDKEHAYRLLQEADIFAENMSFGTVQRLGLGYDEIVKRNPRIIYGNFPGWGREGPYASRGSADNVAQVFAGSVALTGRRGGEPEILRWPALWDFHASLHIVVVLLLGLLNRLRTGNGVSVISPQIGAAVNMQASRIAEYLATGDVPPRMGSGATNTAPHRAYQCKDGRWLAVGVVEDGQWRRLCAAIGAKDLAEKPDLATNSGRVMHREQVDNALAQIFCSMPARWWEIQLRKAKVPVSPFLDATEIINHPQIRANKHFVWLRYPRQDATADVLEYPSIGRFPKLPLLPFGNLPFRYSKTQHTMKAGSLPGVHTRRILQEGWGDGGDPSPGYFGPTSPITTGVLNGVTVVDMSQGIAGPFASQMLALSGARVIKIEPPEGDYTRGWEPQVHGVGAAFFHLNQNKEGLRLNIRKAEDRERLKALLNEADVFIEEEGQARLARWGLDQASLEKTNPRLITCSVSPLGERGPLRDQPATELILQAMSDFLNNLGVAGEEPVRMGPDLASTGTSMYICQAILGALYHQWRTGVGQRIAISQLGALLHQRAVQWTSLVDPDDWNGYLFGYVKPPELMYKTKDQSVLIGPVRDPGNMLPLLKELGMEACLDDPLFKNPPNSLMGTGINGAVDTGDLPHRAKPYWEAAFSQLSAEQVSSILIKHGANCTVVNDYDQLYHHPQTKVMGLFHEADDPAFGRVRYQQLPWTLDGVPVTTSEPYRDLAPITDG